MAYNGDPNAEDAKVSAVQGDEIKHTDGMTLYAEFPLACHVRLLRNGEVIVDTNTQTLSHAVNEPGVYRVEGWLDVNT